MPIEHIHSFLVHPAKNVDEQPPIRGTTIAQRGGLYDMLRDVYDRAPDECNIEVVFAPDEQGEQNNECHNALLAFARSPSIPAGRDVALRLQRVTTHRSGLGLLFLLKGTSARGHHTLVVSRFPADQGIVAEETQDRLSVEFVERVFLRNARAYKSVLYQTSSLDVGFPRGRAVDRQISGPRDLSNYWVRDFLESELATTGPLGSRRLAIALREAIKKAASTDLKQELVSAARLLRGQHGRIASTRDTIRRLGLSQEASAAIEGAFLRPELMDESFRFDAEEFTRHATYRTVQLDNGAMLTAEDANFGDVFDTERLVAEGRVRYSTEGAIVDQKLKKTR